jgi:4-hydroxy-tetrahydrodipicolinate synthase
VTDIKGVCIAMCTPFDETGEHIDDGRMRDYIDELIDLGMHNILLLAGTGEFAYLSEAERRHVIEVAGKHIDGRVPVLAQTSAMSTTATIEASKHAVDHGAEVLMVLPPWLESPFERGVLWHYEQVAKNVPEADIMVYNIPSASGVEVTPDMYRRLLQIDNIGYIKDSAGDLARHQKLIATGGKVFCGADPIAPYALMAGAVGWIWGAANVMPHECVALYDLIAAGRHAEALDLWQLMLPTNMFLWENDHDVEYLVGAKTGANMMGRSLGPNRRPQLPMTGAARVALQTAMSTLPTNRVQQDRLVYREWDTERDWLMEMSRRTRKLTPRQDRNN